MIHDAIMDEVRSIRDELAKECGYDVHELFKALRHLDATSVAAHVSLIPRAGGQGVDQLVPAREDAARGPDGS